MLKKIHVIFKTHLDIGFTDMAQNVVEKYMKLFIPKAIELAEQLDRDGGEARFVWTTGSWLIDQYLKQASDSDKQRMENAIASGHIVWHGLPFTTHTEMMDPELFMYGLSLSNNLDQRFGKKTISSKMTDVPGHTRAMIPYMAKAGIRYLHLGVNPACTVPSVPKLFVWQGTDGSELIVQYSNNYGESLEIEGFEDGVVFAHTGDNCGPPSAAEIRDEFERLSKRYPGAIIQASTMDAFAEALLDIKHQLPIVREEIGDTWIYGVASDPKKVAHYRELLRLRRMWISQGRLDIEGDEYAAFSDELIMIPEHTWGLDEKKFLTDFKHYSLADFHAAREANVISKDAIPDKYAYIGAFAMDEFDSLSKELFSITWNNRSFEHFESSWQEQREYLQKAIQTLSEDKKQEAEAAWAKLVPYKDEAAEGVSLETGTPYSLGKFRAVTFAEDGSISVLIDRHGKSWADKGYHLGEFRYETFGTELFQQWFDDYVIVNEHTYRWIDADMAKPGMEFVTPKPIHAIYRPVVSYVWHEIADEADRVTVRLRLPAIVVQMNGAPSEVEIVYVFDSRCDVIEVSLKWFGKQANRLPEAFWFSFLPKLDNPNLWRMDKMGEWISPLEVVKNGNRNLHAVHSGLLYQGADGEIRIEALDSPLLSPGERRLLQFKNTFAPLDGGMHFNLYNNLFGSNFPMWYEEDALFRYTVSLKSH